MNQIHPLWLLTHLILMSGLTRCLLCWAPHRCEAERAHEKHPSCLWVCRLQEAFSSDPVVPDSCATAASPWDGPASHPDIENPPPFLTRRVKHFPRCCPYANSPPGLASLLTVAFFSRQWYLSTVFNKEWQPSLFYIESIKKILPRTSPNTQISVFQSSNLVSTLEYSSSERHHNKINIWIYILQNQKCPW